MVDKCRRCRDKKQEIQKDQPKPNPPSMPSIGAGLPANQAPKSKQNGEPSVASQKPEQPAAASLKPV